MAVCLLLAGIIAGSFIIVDKLLSSSDWDDVLGVFKQKFNGHDVEHEFPIQNRKTTKIYSLRIFSSEKIRERERMEKCIK